MPEMVYEEYCADCQALSAILAKANGTEVEDEYRDFYDKVHRGEPK